MAEDAKKPRKVARRGRTAAPSVPDMVTHCELAERFKVPTDTLRRWITQEPPLFPKPNVVIGSMMFYEREAIVAFMLKGQWPR